MNLPADTAHAPMRMLRPFWPESEQTYPRMEREIFAFSLLVLHKLGLHSISCRILYPDTMSSAIPGTESLSGSRQQGATTTSNEQARQHFQSFQDALQHNIANHPTNGEEDGEAAGAIFENSGVDAVCCCRD